MTNQVINAIQNGASGISAVLDNSPQNNFIIDAANHTVDTIQNPPDSFKDFIASTGGFVAGSLVTAAGITATVKIDVVSIPTGQAILVAGSGTFLSVAAGHEVNNFTKTNISNGLTAKLLLALYFLTILIRRVYASN